MASLIVVCGLPCTGKSTVSQGLGRALGIPVFSVDPIEGAILRSGIPRSFETGLAAYVVAGTLAEEHLKLGHSAIIDAVSGVIESRNWWDEISTRHGVPQIVIECVCSDPAEHRRRLERRVRGIDGFPEPTWADVDARRDEYLPWSCSRLVLDAIAVPEDNVEKAVAYVACGGEPAELTGSAD